MPINKNKNSYYKKKGKRKPRHKALRGRVDTFAERVAQRIAKKEIDKNKKQKYLVNVQRGVLSPPQMNTTGDLYTEVSVHDYPVLNNIPLFPQDIAEYPVIRSMPKIKDITNFTTSGQIEDTDPFYRDLNEFGFGRLSDAVMIKSFKIDVEIEANKLNTTDREVQVDLVFYESYPEDVTGTTTRFNQYIMRSIDAKQILSTRMIKDCLGAVGGTGVGARESATSDIGSTIKKLLLKRTWVIRPKQIPKEIDPDTKEPTKAYEFIQSHIKNQFYIPINKKVEYTRGIPIDSTAEVRASVGLAIPTQGGYEKVDSYNNRKYYCAMKSNVSEAELVPKVKLIVTTYFTDI